MKTEEIKKNDTQEELKEETPEKTKIEIKEEFKEQPQEKKVKEKKNNKILYLVIPIIILFSVLTVIFAVINKKSNTIIKGILINNIDVSGLTKEQAIEKLTENINLPIEKNEIKLKIENNEYIIKAIDIEFKYNIEEAVDKAYIIGREKNIFVANFNIIKNKISKQMINLNYTYNEELLNAIIDTYNLNLENPIIQASYQITEDELIIIKGKPGDIIDKEDLKGKILEGFRNNQKSIDNVEIKQEEPNKIDIEKIYQEVYQEPKDAYYTEEPFEVFPHKDGIDFDIEEAKQILQEEKEQYQINLIITKPEVLTNQIGTKAFPNLLSEFSTKFDASNTPRVNNLRLASNSINEVVIMPGETFSYNKTLGKRTPEAGYKNAGGFAGGRVVDMIGGGICQISSTLYNAVVLADLEVTERYAHMFQALYVDASRDATVSWGTLDFKFKNTRNYPIMLKAWINGNRAYVEIYGTKEEVEYEIEIQSVMWSNFGYSVVYEDDPNLAPGQQRVSQSGIPGCTSTAYKIKKLNGVEVSKEVLSNDTYKSCSKIIKKGIESIPTVTEPTPEPIPEPIPEPTPEPIPEPTPEPIPEPTPEPIPEPTPEPTPEPIPEPVPEPSPELTPEPTPETE